MSNGVTGQAAMPAGSPIGPIDTLLREGRVSEAMQQLGISASDLSQHQFVESVAKAREALRLLSENNMHGAAALICSLGPLISAVHVEAVRIPFEILYHYSHGLVCLRSGDAFGARDAFDRASTLTARASFTLPGADTLIIYGRIAGEIANSRIETSQGNYGAGEAAINRALGHFTSLKQLLQTQGGHNPGILLESGGLALETHLFFAITKLQLLQLGECRQRLDAALAPAQELEACMRGSVESPPLHVARCLLHTLSALRNIATAADTVLHRTKRVGSRELSLLADAGRDLFNARAQALRSGEQGKIWAATIDLVLIYHQGLSALATPKFDNWIPISNIVSGGAFLLTIAAVRLLINPPSYLWFAYFVGSVVVSLIVGFGYGALRFMPLLQEYKKTIAGSRRKNGS